MGEVILLPKKLRAEWSDLLALDLKVTPTDLRVGMIISCHFSRQKASTYISLDALVRLSGLSRPTVWRAIQRLRELGYLKIKGRELGFREDGRRVRGGRGVANTYEPALDRQKLSSDLAQKVITRAHLFWEERCSSDASKVIMRTEAPGATPAYATRDADPAPTSSSAASTQAGPVGRDFSSVTLANPDPILRALPERAASKVMALRVAVEDASAVSRDVQQRILDLAHDHIDRLKGERDRLVNFDRYGGKPIFEDHPSVLDLDRRIASHIAERDRLQRTLEARRGSLAEVGALLSNLERYVGALLRSGAQIGEYRGPATLSAKRGVSMHDVVDAQRADANHVFTYVAQRTRKGRVKGKRYPLTYNGVKSRWRRQRAAAKLDGFRFHDFRHDLGTKLLRHTGNLKLVQKALNHSDIKTTTRYAHVLDDEVAAALEEMSRKKPRTKSKKAG
ncbi:MAG: tyrosine-type recombinase/integrase [Variibacter sp.]